MIEQLLPAGVVAVEAFEDVPGEPVFRGEEDLVANAVESRRREFVTGRRCAREALAKLGHARWLDRDLSAQRYVYFWVDGIHVQARLKGDAQCLLVIIGATSEGKKELVGLIDGVRESAQSWKELLLDLKRRGLAIGPELAVADGALGFWKALPEVWPKAREQRRWVHKTANVLNRLPKSLQGKAKRALQDIWMAETRTDAEAAFDTFAEIYGTKYDKAVECLTKDRDVLLAFYDSPSEQSARKGARVDRSRPFVA